MASEFDGLPAFFTNGSVDDSKYESLLADLRAHDLLGPVESGAQGDTSLFFNDAFSAVFMGNFQSSTKGNTSSRPPPGLASPSDDLKWARGQEEFSRLKEKFHGSDVKTQSSSEGRAPPGLTLEQDAELEESQVPGLSGLGLDDDDSAVDNVSQLPPLPQAPAPPQVNFAPPIAPPHHHFMPPPHMHGPPPHPTYIQNHPMPPQPPPYFGRGPPFHSPPFGRPPPPQQMHPPAFKMMTPRDVHFVMQQQVKWLRCSDPFSDDYYFHNYMQKRARAGVPGSPAVPLPSWKLQHVKSIDPRDAQREVKSRNWESEYHVLGRNTKSSLYRPKQVLNLMETEDVATSNSSRDAEDPECSPSNKEKAAVAAAELSSEEENSKHVRGSSPGALVVAAEARAAKVLRMSENASRDSVFANSTWKLRLQLDRGMQCLLSLQEARHLLDARGINVQQFHSLRENEMDAALVELRARTTALLLELAALVGVSVTEQADESVSSGLMQCNVQQLKTMLTANKGKALVSRSLPLLHPSARFVLLPHLVDHLLSGQMDARHQLTVNDAADDRLCQTVVLILRYIPPAPPVQLLTECLQRALAGHDVHSLSAVLRDRARAESLQTLLQCGGSAVQQLNESENNDIKLQWEHHQSVFVQLATAIKGAT